MNRHQKGQLGEDIANVYLERRGFVILEHGFRCKRGEVDLIAKKDGEYYFIEVKTRWSGNFGNPLESVTPAKQKQVIKAARIYIAKQKLFNAGCHLSAIGVDMSGSEPKVEFIEDAFEVEWLNG